MDYSIVSLVHLDSFLNVSKYNSKNYLQKSGYIFKDEVVKIDSFSITSEMLICDQQL